MSRECSVCKSTNLSHKEVVGRGLPPKGHNHTNKKVSWKGTWDVYTCNECGDIVKTLRR